MPWPLISRDQRRQILRKKAAAVETKQAAALQPARLHSPRGLRWTRPGTSDAPAGPEPVATSASSVRRGGFHAWTCSNSGSARLSAGTCLHLRGDSRYDDACHDASRVVTALGGSAALWWQPVACVACPSCASAWRYRAPLGCAGSRCGRSGLLFGCLVLQPAAPSRPATTQSTGSLSTQRRCGGRARRARLPSGNRQYHLGHLTTRHNSEEQQAGLCN